MKSLVEIAKEMGFNPNPNLTKDDWQYVVDALKTYFLHMETGLPTDHPSEQKRRSKFNNLPSLIYYTNCLKKREGSDEAVQQNLDLLKSTKNKLAFPAPQSFPGDLKTTPFVWHHSKEIRESHPLRERFTVDIDLSSQKFPDMMKKLDRFITDHPASYKITNNRSRNRIDTLNMYLSEDISPEIAQEFYGIVKPCLDSSHHQQLNGREIFIGTTPVQGIKIGPILCGERSNYNERIEHQDKLLQQDIKDPDLQLQAKMILKDWVGEEPHFDRETNKEVAAVQPSLGMVSTAVELMNLMYYMIGKEGQNPFQLLGYDNKPYQKHISLNLTTEKEKPKMADSIWKKMTSFFKKSDKTPKMQTSSFDWEDSKLWSDVQVEHDGRVYFGHRIKISSLSDADREALKAGLKKRGINYTERQATTRSGDIFPGDLTIRITEPESIQKLRSFVFKWAEGPHTRPISKSKEEYQAERELIREKRLAKISPSSDKPKWADKRYWEKVNDGEKGYVMDLGTAARYNDLGQPEGAPFNEEIIIKELAKKGIQAEKRVSGFSNCLPSYKMTHDSLVILGEENAKKFEQMYLKEGQNLSSYAIRGQGGER